MKGNHDHFLEVNFYNISTKEEKDNLINFVTFYCSNLINIRNQYVGITNPFSCLLYTSDAADERSSVDLGGRRIIKKKIKKNKKKKRREKKKKADVA